MLLLSQWSRLLLRGIAVEEFVGERGEGGPGRIRKKSVP
jgi:hypothetical protein